MDLGVNGSLNSRAKGSKITRHLIDVQWNRATTLKLSLGKGR